MGRPAKVDREKAIQMIKGGQTNRQIADYFQVSHQAISPLRKLVKGDGSKPVTPAVQPKFKREHYNWTEIQEAILQTFQQAKRADELEGENWTLRNRTSALEAKIKAVQDRLGSEQVYEEMVKRGQLPTPLTIRGDKNRLTKS